MRELRRFEMYYFSEVNADILYRYRPEYERYKISATHTTSNVPISCWFHFSDVEVEDKEDPLHFESDGPVEPLALMAGKLAPGPKAILERADVPEPRRQFFTDFMCALANGDYNINDGRDVEYKHPAGDWLMEMTERFK